MPPELREGVAPRPATILAASSSAWPLRDVRVNKVDVVAFEPLKLPGPLAGGSGSRGLSLLGLLREPLSFGALCMELDKELPSTFSTFCVNESRGIFVKLSLGSGAKTFDKLRLGSAGCVSEILVKLSLGSGARTFDKLRLGSAVACVKLRSDVLASCSI